MFSIDPHRPAVSVCYIWKASFSYIGLGNSLGLTGCFREIHRALLAQSGSDKIFGRVLLKYKLEISSVGYRVDAFCF